MLQTKTEPIKFTILDIEALASQNYEKKYEIIDGELFVTRSPHINHQDAGGNVYFALQTWSKTRLSLYEKMIKLLRLFYLDFLARFNNFLAK